MIKLGTINADSPKDFTISISLDSGVSKEQK